MGKLHEAVKASNVKEVKKLLNVENPNDRDSFYQTPLHIACGASPNIEIVRLLLKKKADTNVQDRNGWTPLHCSASNQNLDICELLLQVRDIDVSVLNKDGTSALHYLVRNNPPEEQQVIYRTVLDLYVERRGDVNSQSKHGEAALHQACLRGNIAAVRFLLANQANINMLNKIGETCLHYAVRAGQKEIIELLIDNGADVSIRSEEGTPLDICPAPELQAVINKALEKHKASAPAKKTPDTMPEEVKIYDPSEFKLKVKIVRGHNITNDAGDIASPFCQVQFGDQKKTTKVKSSTNAPKWNETFLFDINDISEPIKCTLYHQEGDKPPTKDDSLGFTQISLTDLDIDMSGSGEPLKNWYNLRRRKTSKTAKQIGKLRLEISYILKSTLENIQQGKNLASDEVISDITASTESIESSASDNSSGTIFGWKRGKCKVADCDCDIYQPENERGGHCQNCGHWPAQHANLGKDDPVAPPTNSGAGASAPASPGIDSESTMSDIAAKFAASHKHMLNFTWEIDSSELVFTKRLGEGTSAKVFRGTYRNQDVAIKVLKEKAEAKVLEEFKKEFEIMSSLRSPHVVFFFGACIRPSLCMVLEFCHKGALFDVLNDLREDITWSRVFKAASDTVRGLLCLHSWRPQIVHRDLKSLNLLVDENWTVKVSDFGTARFTGGDQADLATLGKLRGTYAYCAPEVYFGKNFTPKSDIYSFGVILWEMAFRCITGTYETPFSEFKHIQFDFQIIIQSAKMEKRPTIPEKCPENYAAIIRRCWDMSPDVRPDTSELQQIVRDLEKEYNEHRDQWDALRTPAIPPPEEETPPEE